MNDNKKSAGNLTKQDGIICFTIAVMVVSLFFASIWIVSTFLPDGITTRAADFSPGVMFLTIFFTICTIFTVSYCYILKRTTQAKADKPVDFDCSASKTISSCKKG